VRLVRLRLALTLLPGLLVACGNDTAVQSPWPEPPALELDLRVTVDPLEVSLLQPVRVTLDRYRRDGVEVSFVPEVDDKSFATKDSKTGDERSYGDGFWQRTTMILLPIAGPGELKIPSFRAETVVAAGEQPQIATTPEQALTVTTALSAEYGAEIEAPGDPFPTPFGGWWWIFGAVVAIAFLAGFRWLSRRQPSRSPAAIVVPAHIKALRELYRWRAAMRTTEAEIDAFYVGVSQVLRVYLEERFGLRAPERTTEEFLRDIDGSQDLVREHKEELKGFLTQCDMVKFARFVPTPAAHEKTFQLAEAFIESTRADRITAASGAGSRPPQQSPQAPASMPPELPPERSEVSP